MGQNCKDLYLVVYSENFAVKEYYKALIWDLCFSCYILMALHISFNYMPTILKYPHRSMIQETISTYGKGPDVHNAAVKAIQRKYSRG